VNDHFNATVLDDSLVLIIFDNMHKPFMLMRKYLEILLQRRVQDFNDKFEQNEFDLLQHVHAHQLSEAKEVTAEDIVEIFQLQA
jgi:hypothetical protein